MAKKANFAEMAAQNLAVVFADQDFDRLESCTRAWHGLTTLIAGCDDVPDGPEMYALMSLILDEQWRVLQTSAKKGCD
jgi:hypothetical protein